MKKIKYVIVLLLLLGGALFAQNQKVVLSFFEDSSGDFKIVNADATDELYGDELDFGSEVPVGWTVVTGNGDSAELQVEPSKTIIKVSENTNFHIDGLQGMAGAEESRFSLGFGKIRCVAGKITGKERYVFKGNAATCGVRGTDWIQQIMQSAAGKMIEEVLVLAGEIEYSLIADPAKKILVKAGEFANALADSFEALIASAQKKAEFEQKMDFKQLDPGKVPKITAAPSVETPPEETADKPDEKSGEGGLPEEAEGYLTQLLGDMIGFEIGSITINDQTYAKAVATPTFGIGKLKMSLYLPVIYSENLLDPADWYKPNGNSEWSFGFDQLEAGGNWWDFTKDFANDLFLKIKYVQWGDIRDPFFFKVGNLANFTVGHGLIMRNYANDAEFPAIRRIGLNFGFDLDRFGFETVVNDLADPLIFGGRFYVRPFGASFPLAVGLSGIVDIGPAFLESPDINLDEMGRPIFINAGLDVDLPIIERNLLSIILFGDVAGMMPYFSSNGAGIYSSITQGLAWQMIFNTTDGFSLKNIGAAAGFFGNVGPIDWRLEYRYYTGSFKPAVIDAHYDKYRFKLAEQTALYANDLTSFDQINMGIYGEAGWTLADIFTLSAGYEWPLAFSGGKAVAAEDDHVFLKAILERGVIPVVDVGAEVSYERRYFVPWLFGDKTDDSGYDLTFFDAYTGIKTAVVYGVSKNIDMLLLITTSLKRNPDGTIYFDPATYLPDLVNTFSFETQLHF